MQINEHEHAESSSASGEPSDVLSRLSRRQVDFEARLDRVENSVLFRTLQWIGGRARQALTWRSHARQLAAHGADPDYTRWAAQSDWLQPSPEECHRNMALWRYLPRFNYLVHPGATSASLRATLDSIAAQAYASGEILQVADAAAAGPVAAAPGASLQNAWQRVLRVAKDEHTVIVPSGALLSPVAAYRWAELLQTAGGDAIYSDWDHVNEKGQRHAPRFTPELSPELLLRTPYWGQCFVVRTALLQEIGSDLNPADPGWTHSLALRLIESTRNVIRLPEVLWHSAGEPRRTTSADVANPPLDGGSGATGDDEAEASIIVCSRTPALLRRCLRALHRGPAARAELIVVAHSQGDETRLEQIARKYGARVVPYSGPFHFGIMNALGVQQASRRIVVFLNDDVEPIAPGWLAALVRQVRKNQIGVAGGLLLYPDGTVQHAGIVVGSRPIPCHAGRGQMSSPWWPWLRMTREVTAVTGACLALRRPVWDELGGFDRRFPVNYNDVDLCFRARRAGYSVVLESEALLYHREAQSRATRIQPKERLLFDSIWDPALATQDPFFNPSLSVMDEKILLDYPCTGS